jgi:hypothetical protein
MPIIRLQTNKDLLMPTNQDSEELLKHVANGCVAVSPACWESLKPVVRAHKWGWRVDGEGEGEDDLAPPMVSKWR